MSKTPKAVTSIRIDKDIYDEFKVRCVKDKFSLSKLVSLSISSYLDDKEFRQKLLNNKHK